MKKILAISLAVATALTLTSCGVSNQSSDIKAACKLADAKNFTATQKAFTEIAQKDPGYIDVAIGAQIWARYEGSPLSDTKTYVIVKSEVWKPLHSFYAVCGIPAFLL